MQARIVYLVRHGRIRLEDDRPRYVGQLDVPLSKEGERHAGELARRLRRAELGAIYSSDLSRSAQTARIVAEALGLSAWARPDLREVSLGAWEGCVQRDIQQRFPEEFRARGEDFGHYRPPGGESFLECSERVVRAFHEIVRSSRGDLLVVGHAGANRLLLCHLLGMLPANLFRLGQDYGCCNLLHCEGSRYQVMVVNGSNADLLRAHPHRARGRATPRSNGFTPATNSNGRRAAP